MLPSFDDMNLQVFGGVAEIVSALAVPLTLIGLIIRIRQNAMSQKALVVDSLAAAITSINIPAMESDVLGSALSKATTDWSSASRQERIGAHYFLFSFFKLLENACYQQRAGILGQARWLGWERLLRKYYIPIKRARSGGRVANTRIYQNLRNISPKQNRRKSLAA